MKTASKRSRRSFANIWKQVVDTREPLIVQCKGAEDLAILPAAELAGLEETAHLLRSPKNAQRLLAALRQSLAGKGKPQTLASLKAEVGLAGGK